MTINEAKKLNIGDFVKIINTHKEKKTGNDECIWVVVGINNIIRSRSPIMTFDLKLIKGPYKYWDRNEIIEEGMIINRTNRALKKVNIISIMTEDV